jgi:hypothetical protein
MSFSITFNITAEPEAAVAKIMGEARRVGVELNGDDRQGTFAGFNARGTYSREGNQIHITVIEKPFFVPETLLRRMAVEKAPEWGLAVA